MPGQGGHQRVHRSVNPPTITSCTGFRQFHGWYSVGDDTMFGVVRHCKSADNTLAGLQSIRAVRPDGGPIYVILDNLSAHKAPQIRRWAERNRVELGFTPTYSSWANLIEPHFGPLREFVLNNSNRPNHVWVRLAALWNRHSFSCFVTHAEEPIQDTRRNVRYRSDWVFGV